MSINKKTPSGIIPKGVFFVRLKGLEPPRLSAPDPKSGAATNYATTAGVFFSITGAKIQLIFKLSTKGQY